MVHYLIVLLLLLVLAGEGLIYQTLGASTGSFEGLMAGGVRLPAPVNLRTDPHPQVSQALTHADRMEMKFAADDAAARKRRVAAIKGGNA